MPKQSVASLLQKHWKIAALTVICGAAWFFLPGVVWFDDKNDLTFGTAYISEDAFDNPQSKLKFVGATIHRASKADWDAFQSTLAQNLLNPLPYTGYGLVEVPNKDEVLAGLKDKSLTKTWQNLLSCHGVARYRLSDQKSREILRKFWPANRPRFWMHNDLKDPWTALRTSSDPIMINGSKWQEYATSSEVIYGFPTRARGGSFRSDQTGGKLLPQVYPMRSSSGLKWVKSDQGSQPIINDIDIRGGLNQGFLYCFAGSGIEIAYPRIFFEHVYTRVDGAQVQGETEDDRDPSGRPYIFYENDEYFYQQFDIVLN